MKGQASFISYLLDAEGMICLVEERLKDASELAVRCGLNPTADSIAEVQERIMEANLALFRILVSIEHPRLIEHLECRETPIAQDWTTSNDRGNEEDTVRITLPRPKK